MTETEKNHCIRWLLLVPGVLVASALALTCGLMMIAMLTLLADFFVMLAFILPATTAVAWVSSAYYIAPSHHVAVIWGAYIAGNLFMLIFFPTPSLWWNAAIGGVLACGYCIDKHTKSEKIETQRNTQ